jgi:hypothetical protein
MERLELLYADGRSFTNFPLRTSQKWAEMVESLRWFHLVRIADFSDDVPLDYANRLLREVCNKA